MNERIVLYIEDDPQNRLLVRRILSSKNYTMIEAGDGVIGLETIRTAKPKLVLLDIDLPRMDGFEVIRHVRADDEICHTTVVALTASTNEGDRERFLQAGCNDYLAKPVTVQGLLKIVEDYYPA